MEAARIKLKKSKKMEDRLALELASCQQTNVELEKKCSSLMADKEALKRKNKALEKQCAEERARARNGISPTKVCSMLASTIRPQMEPFAAPPALVSHASYCTKHSVAAIGRDCTCGAGHGGCISTPESRSGSDGESDGDKGSKKKQKKPKSNVSISKKKKKKKKKPKRQGSKSVASSSSRKQKSKRKSADAAEEEEEEDGDNDGDDDDDDDIDNGDIEEVVRMVVEKMKSKK